MRLPALFILALHYLNILEHRIIHIAYRAWRVEEVVLWLVQWKSVPKALNQVGVGNKWARKGNKIRMFVFQNGFS